MAVTVGYITISGKNYYSISGRITNLVDGMTFTIPNCCKCITDYNNVTHIAPGNISWDMVNLSGTYSCGAINNQYSGQYHSGNVEASFFDYAYINNRNVVYWEGATFGRSRLSLNKLTTGRDSVLAYFNGIPITDSDIEPAVPNYNNAEAAMREYFNSLDADKAAGTIINFVPGEAWFDANVKIIVKGSYTGTWEWLPLYTYADYSTSGFGNAANINIGSPYNITIPTQVGGTITTSPATQAYSGDTVTVTAIPNYGYQCDNVIFINANGGTSQNATRVDANTYQFTMPSYAVQVTAQWSEVETVGLEDFFTETNSIYQTGTTVYYTLDGQQKNFKLKQGYISPSSVLLNSSKAFSIYNSVTNTQFGASNVVFYSDSTYTTALTPTLSNGVFSNDSTVYKNISFAVLNSNKAARFRASTNNIQSDYNYNSRPYLSFMSGVNIGEGELSNYTQDDAYMLLYQVASSKWNVPSAGVNILIPNQDGTIDVNRYDARDNTGTSGTTNFSPNQALILSDSRWSSIAVSPVLGANSSSQVTPRYLPKPGGTVVNGYTTGVVPNGYVAIGTYTKFIAIDNTIESLYLPTGYNCIINVYPTTNYFLRSIKNVNNNQEYDLTKVSNGVYTLEVRSGNNEISPVFSLQPVLSWDTPDNGSFRVDVNGAGVNSGSQILPGRRVVITVSPNRGFILRNISVYSNGVLVPTEVEGYVGVFTMPEDDAAIEVRFVEGIKYYIDTQIYTNGEQSSAGGSAYCSPDETYAGVNVKLNISLNYGYTFKSASIISENTGNIIAAITTTTTTFIMPSENVLVRVFLTGSSDGDPNAAGGTSEPGGGNGNHDDNSDLVPSPSLPSVTCVGTGLVSLFRPSAAQLSSLGSYLWTNLTNLPENIQKWLTNPQQYLISYNIFPVVPDVSSDTKVFIGNYVTSILMPPVTSQWYDFDCGSISVNPYWGSALDYAPYTKIQLMLPFIGSVQLNTDEVMGKTLALHYRIDLLSGVCVAMMAVNGNIYYQWTGQCSMNVPLSASDFSRVYRAAIGAVGTAIAGGVGVGAAAANAASGMGSQVAAQSYRAAAAAGNAYAAINETSKGTKGVNAMRTAMIEAAQNASDNAKAAASKSVTRSEGVRNMRMAASINNTVGAVMGAKAVVSHSGTVSGAAGFLGVRTAYLIIEYPNQSLADNYKHFAGYPSNVYSRLGNLTGYTECEQVIPKGIWGTDDELAELVEILKHGVYL